MKTKLLPISSIVTTAGTQIRARIDDETVEQYAGEMTDAANKFPPVVVFHDGSQFILADGFHRILAASRNQFLDIEADVRKGTRADALKFALGANSTHGLKRTNADKRRSVELALTEWPTLSDREIARICAVSDHFVGDTRKINCEQIAVGQPATRIGADGKERRLPTRKATEPEASEASVTPIQPQPEPTPEPAPEPEPPKPGVGIDSSHNFFAVQFEDIASAVISEGTDQQLANAIGAAQAAVKAMQQEKNRRRTV